MNTVSYPDRATAPATGEFNSRSLPAPVETMLSNGIRLRSLHREDYELVKISIVSPTGTMDYAPDIAHIRGRMLKEGSKDFSGEEIAECLDFNGASVVSQPMNHATVTSLTALRRNLHKVLPVFFDMLLHPVFPEKELDAIKRQTLTELHCNLETPSFNAMAEIRRMIAGSGHRYGLCQTDETIGAVTSARLQECQARSIDSSSMQVFVAGYADDKVIGLVSEYLAHISPDRHRYCLNPCFFKPEDPGIRRIQVDDSLQHALMASVPSIGYGHPDYWPLRLAVHALGGYFGSRLMQNIREDKGYTYGIGASLTCMPEGNFVTVSCECDPAYTDSVLEEINYEFRRFSSFIMTDQEYRRMQSSLASKLATICDTPMSIQSQYLTQDINNTGVDFYDRFWEAVLSVTPEQMSQAAAKYLNPDALRIAIAGNFKK